MRFLLTILSVLACATGIKAQDNTHPFKTFTATVASTYNGNPPSDGVTSPAIIPNFAAYNQENFRYALESANEGPITFRFDWTYHNIQTDELTGHQTDVLRPVRVRNCGTSLATPYQLDPNTEREISQLPGQLTDVDTAATALNQLTGADNPANTLLFDYTFCEYEHNLDTDGNEIKATNGDGDELPLPHVVIPAVGPRTGTIRVRNLMGTAVLEFATYYNYQGRLYPFSYLITVSVLRSASVSGLNMWTFDVGRNSKITGGIARFTVPFINTQSSYTIKYALAIDENDPDLVDKLDMQHEAADLYIPFFLGTQKTVTYISVQECYGRPCQACPLPVTLANQGDSTSELLPKKISRVFNTGTSTLIDRQTCQEGVTSTSFTSRKQVCADQIDDSLASWRDQANVQTYFNQNTENKAQHGLYYYPASTKARFGYTAGQNCVRFLNRIITAGGENEVTITVDMNLNNCREKTCEACVADPDCGWCVYSNYNEIPEFSDRIGSCEVGTEFSASSRYGLQPFYDGILFDFAATCQVAPANDRLLVPRWAFDDPEGCSFHLKGDPRIAGLQGQDFQVHGTPNEYFNLVSSAKVQINSRFIYLEDAQCDNFTACFSHPGTYIDEIGVMMGEDKIRLVAGGIKEAARVFLNGREVQVSNHKHIVGPMSVVFAHPRRITVRTPEFLFTALQSDKFFNMDSSLLKTELLDMGSKVAKFETSRHPEVNNVMHGLIGQTWRNVLYAGNREYEGEVTDYQVADGLWGSDFTFNLYGKN